MTLYRLHPPGVETLSRELVADSDEHAREVAADQFAQALHKDPGSVLDRWEDGSWVSLLNTSPIEPAHPVAAPEPPLERFEPLVKVHLYERDQTRHRLGELSEALSQVERAIRQLERSQAAHRAEQARRAEVGFTEGFVPDDIVALGVDRDDAMEFAIIAAGRAVAAHRYLTRRRGLDLPPLRQGPMVWELRNLFEHWDEWKVVDRDTLPDGKPWLRTRTAGRNWDEASDGEVPLGYLHTTAAPPPGPPADPQGRIRSWSGIDFDHLAEDLQALSDAIAVHKVGAYEYEWPTDEAAITLVGPTMMGLIHSFTTLRGFRARDGVRRWERALLLAADKKIREQHWIINGEVVGTHPQESTAPPELR